MALAVDANDNFELSYQHGIALTWNNIIKHLHSIKNNFPLAFKHANFTDHTLITFAKLIFVLCITYKLYLKWRTVSLIMQEFLPGSRWTSSQVRHTHTHIHIHTHTNLCNSSRWSTSCWFSRWHVGFRGRLLSNHLQSSGWGRAVN